MVREVLSELIAADPALELVGVATDAQAAISLASDAAPHVAIVDVRMPGGGGAFATRGVMDVSPGTKVIAFSGDFDDALAEQLRAAGAVKQVLKGGPIGSILEAIHEAVAADAPAGTT